MMPQPNANRPASPEESRHARDAKRTLNRLDLRSRCTVPLLCLASAGWLAGCELGSDLQEAARELGNPDAETIEQGGRLIAEGNYRRLRFDGSTADDAFVVAMKDGNELEIIPFTGDPGCSAGPATNSVASMTQSDRALDARIPFLTPATEDEPATLKFTNFACDIDQVTVPNGSLPSSRDFTRQPGFIVQAATDGELWFVSPWENDKRLITSDAAPIRGSDLLFFADGEAGAPWLWTLEKGRLMARDRELSLVFTAGEDVSAVVHSSGGAGGPMLALLDSEKTLSTVLASAPDEVTEVARDACGVRFNNGNYGRELLYYSPCEDRTLRVYELETDTRRTIREGIDDFDVRGATNTGPLLVYVTDVEENGGTLWARWGQNEPIRLGEQGPLDMARMTSTGWTRVVVDWNGETGRLLVGQLGEELEELAQGVNYHGGAGVIANFDGYNGDFYELTEERGLQLIVENVSPVGLRSDRQTDRTLLINDFDGTEGRLYMLEGNTVRKMTRNVRAGSYQFTALLPMVTLLSDFDDESNTATLKLHRTDRDEEIIVAEGVAETIEVAWPTEGLLYSAPAGDPPGIYFARAL